MNCCGDKSDYVCSAFEELELGRIHPVAWKVWVVVNTKTVRKDNILEAISLSDVFVLWLINLIARYEMV